MCCLSKPDDRPELEKIRNQWMTPKELIKVYQDSASSHETLFSEFQTRSNTNQAVQLQKMATGLKF